MTFFSCNSCVHVCDCTIPLVVLLVAMFPVTSNEYKGKCYGNMILRCNTRLIYCVQKARAKKKIGFKLVFCSVLFIFVENKNTLRHVSFLRVPQLDSHLSCTDHIVIIRGIHKAIYSSDIRTFFWKENIEVAKLENILLIAYYLLNYKAFKDFFEVPRPCSCNITN